MRSESAWRFATFLSWWKLASSLDRMGCHPSLESAVATCCPWKSCPKEVQSGAAGCRYACSYDADGCASHCEDPGMPSKEEDRFRWLEEVQHEHEGDSSSIADLEYVSGGRSEQGYCVVTCSILGYEVTLRNEAYLFNPKGEEQEGCTCVEFEGRMSNSNLILAEEEGVEIRVQRVGGQIFFQFVEAGLTILEVSSGSFLGLPEGDGKALHKPSFALWLAALLWSRAVTEACG